MKNSRAKTQDPKNSRAKTHVQKLTILAVLIFFIPSVMVAQVKQVAKWSEVKNLTQNKYITAVVIEKLGELGITTKVVIKEIKTKRKESAFVLKNEGFYTIFVNSKIHNIREVISHESLHIEQMEIGRLEQVVDGFIWEGVFYPDQTPYNLRKWERDAHKRDFKLKNK